MLVGILAANMSTLDAMSVSNSALFIRNLYEPIFPGRSEKHYLLVGRIVIGVSLLGGIGAAMFVDNLLEIFKYLISIPAIFGAPIWLSICWRRLTKTAVKIEVGVCFILFAFIPNLFLGLDWARTNPDFLVQTEGYSHVFNTPALTEDVNLGRATAVGDSIEKEVWIEPKGVFFEKVVRENPEDPNSSLIGIGRFEAEIWVMSWFGVDFTTFSKAQLVASRFFFVAFFPFLILFGVSMLTRPAGKAHLDYFYGKIFTPIQKTTEEDEEAVAYTAANPDSIRAKKLFPDSNWEFAIPDRMDWIGFGGSWVMVGVILILLWTMLTIGR
jgi:SSS family solute:Na+ symporter